MKRHRLGSIATTGLAGLLATHTAAFELSSANHRSVGSSLAGGGR